MENKKNLFAAFVKFSEEFRGMKPDANNPFFKSTYISLDGILEVTRPILAKYGLAVMQEATGDGEYIYVKTILVHNSGESYSTDVLKMKPQKNDPQQMGSCITYSKRYQLAALIGVSDLDDDGNKATYGDGTPTLSDAQVNRLYAIGTKAGITKQKVLEGLKLKYNVTEANKLTKVQYDEVCASLESRAK